MDPLVKPEDDNKTMNVKNIDSQEFKELLSEEGSNVEIVDVREDDEFAMIKIKGSKLIPVSQIGTRLNEIDWGKKVVVVCRSGSRSSYIAAHLAAMGKDVMNLQGGIQELNQINYDLLVKNPDCCEGYF